MCECAFMSRYRERVCECAFMSRDRERVCVSVRL